MGDMKKKTILRLMVLLLAASVACAACGGGANMYKHSRSNCNCPEF